MAQYGSNQLYSGWQFVPGYRNGNAPFGTWTVAHVYVLSAYLNGTDNCTNQVNATGCPDDVAVLTLNSQSGDYPGNHTSWFGFWYGTGAGTGGFTSNNLIQITQLGYPQGLSWGAYMERNDSYGYQDSNHSNNTVIGSNMDGGSSGGPWFVNFGLPYTLTGETNGSGYYPNAIIGVTSWGYLSTGPKELAASPFTSGNIQTLFDLACSATNAACS